VHRADRGGRAKALLIQAFQRECTPGYYNNEGRVGEGRGITDEQYGGGPIEFHELIRKWRAEGMEGLRFS
jgi:hypothetical protein